MPNPGRALGAANLYEILQVKPFADSKAIRGAYRRLARVVHPDVNRTPEATQRMQAINQAYAVLRDPVGRAVYDRTRISRALQDAFAGVPTAAPPPAGRGLAPVQARRAGRILGAALAMIGLAGIVWTHGPESWSSPTTVLEEVRAGIEHSLS